MEKPIKFCTNCGCEMEKRMDGNQPVWWCDYCDNEQN